MVRGGGGGGVTWGGSDLGALGSVGSFFGTWFEGLQSSGVQGLQRFGTSGAKVVRAYQKLRRSNTRSLVEPAPLGAPLLRPRCASTSPLEKVLELFGVPVPCALNPKP